MLPARSTVNVYTNDEYSFVWSVLAAIYPIETRSDLSIYYQPHFHEIKTKSLVFPMEVESIPAFEKLNPRLAINEF